MSSIAAVSEFQEYPWYAIRTKSRLESVTFGALSGKGFESYLPSYKSRKQWSDRIVEMEKPLFPGYLFCRFDVVRRLPVLTTPGVMSIVSFGKDPEPIEDSEIRAIRTVLRSGAFAEPCPFLRNGQKVRIVRGALTGIEGILVKKKTDFRLVISVTLLQRSVSIEIDSSWIADGR